MVYMELGYGRRRQELAFRMRLAVGSGRKDGESWLSVIRSVVEGQGGLQRVREGREGVTEGHARLWRVRGSWRVTENHARWRRVTGGQGG